MDVRNGVQLAPKASRLHDLLVAGVDLVIHARASPLQLASFGGMLQWHDLMSRAMLSCLDRFYAFTRAENENEKQPVWPDVLSELTHNLSLFPLWITDLTRPWLPRVPATGASCSFGFGFCFAECPPDAVRSAAAHVVTMNTTFD